MVSIPVNLSANLKQVITAGIFAYPDEVDGITLKFRVDDQHNYRQDRDKQGNSERCSRHAQ